MSEWVSEWVSESLWVSLWHTVTEWVSEWVSSFLLHKYNIYGYYLCKQIMMIVYSLLLRLHLKILIHHYLFRILIFNTNEWVSEWVSEWVRTKWESKLCTYFYASRCNNDDVVAYLIRIKNPDKWVSEWVSEWVSKQLTTSLFSKIVREIGKKVFPNLIWAKWTLPMIAAVPTPRACPA